VRGLVCVAGLFRELYARWLWGVMGECGPTKINAIDGGVVVDVVVAVTAGTDTCTPVSPNRMEVFDTFGWLLRLWEPELGVVVERCAGGIGGVWTSRCCRV